MNTMEWFCEVLAKQGEGGEWNLGKVWMGGWSLGEVKIRFRQNDGVLDLPWLLRLIGPNFQTQQDNKL